MIVQLDPPTLPRFTISIRDLLSWVGFMNTCCIKCPDEPDRGPTPLDPCAAYVHGACLVFLDALGEGIMGIIDYETPPPPPPPPTHTHTHTKTHTHSPSTLPVEVGGVMATARKSAFLPNGHPNIERVFIAGLHVRSTPSFGRDTYC